MTSALLVVILAAGAAALVHVLQVGRFRSPSGKHVTRQDDARSFLAYWIAGVLAYAFLLVTGLRRILGTG